MEAQLAKWSFGLIWGIWGLSIIVHMVARRSWMDLLMIPVVQTMAVVFLMVIFESGWVMFGFVLVANVAMAVYVILSKQKKDLPPLD